MKELSGIHVYRPCNNLVSHAFPRNTTRSLNKTPFPDTFSKYVQYGYTTAVGQISSPFGGWTLPTVQRITSAFNPTPYIPPNASLTFQDTQETPTQIPCVREVPRDLYMSDSNNQPTDTELELQGNLTEQVIALTSSVHIILKKIKQSERVVRHTSIPPPTGYYNDPALVEKLAILTTKRAELDRQALLKTIQSTTPPPPPPTY